MLVKALLEAVRQLDGVSKVDLMVVTENESAIRLYESIGFVRYGREPRALKAGDRYWDEYLMVYFLDGYTME